MNRIVLSSIFLGLLFMFCSPMNAQQTWTPKSGNGFLNKVSQALDLTAEQATFAKTALKDSRTYTRAQYREMTPENRKDARETSTNDFFARLETVLSAPQKAKLTKFRS